MITIKRRESPLVTLKSRNLSSVNALTVLEDILDCYGDPAGVLDALSEIAQQKADHLLGNWQDEQRGRLWEAVSRKLERQATSLRKLGNPYA